MKKIMATAIIGVNFTFSAGLEINAEKWYTPIKEDVTADSVGYPSYDFNNLADELGWKTIDINGDNRKDIVVFHKKENGVDVQFGYGDEPYWKVYLNTGKDFSQDYVTWKTPKDIGFSDQGIFWTESSNVKAIGDELWSLFDINGDGKLDLVFYAYNSSDGIVQFGNLDSPYWKVFLNEGSSFTDKPIIWKTPKRADEINQESFKGFNRLWNVAGYSVPDEVAWHFEDYDGDALIDLIVCSAAGIQFDFNSKPYWKVYRNTGSGFSSTFEKWYTPIIKNSTRGIYIDNVDGWKTKDIDGDGLIDIINTSYYENGKDIQLGYPDDPHWDVYLNKGTSFSTTPIKWKTPLGGVTKYGVNVGMPFLTRPQMFLKGDESYDLKDMNNDGKVDLIKYGEFIGKYYGQFGLDSTQYWKVYFNQGNSFSKDAFKWTTPSGGKIYSKSEGFWGGANGTSHTENVDTFILDDLNGDGVQELVITSKVIGGYSNQFGLSEKPYWKVYHTDKTIVPNLNSKFEQEIQWSDLKKNVSKFQEMKVFDSAGKLLFNKRSFDHLQSDVLNKLTKGIYYVQFKNNEEWHKIKILELK